MTELSKFNLLGNVGFYGGSGNPYGMAI